MDLWKITITCTHDTEVNNRVIAAMIYKDSPLIDLFTPVCFGHNFYYDKHFIYEGKFVLHQLGKCHEAHGLSTIFSYTRFTKTMIKAVLHFI